MIKRLKNEQLLQQAFLDQVMHRVNANLDHPAQQIFNFRTLLFLKELKTEVLAGTEKEHSEESEIRQKIKAQLDSIDRKDRINRSKVIPELEELATLYGCR